MVASAIGIFMSANDSDGPPKDRIEHRMREFSCKGVLLTRMEGSQQHHALVESDLDAVSKFWHPHDRRPAEFRKTPYGRIETNFSEAHDHPDPFQLSEFPKEKRATMKNLRRQQLVLRWCTPARRRDIAVCESQPVVPGDGFRLIRKPKFVESPVQPVSASVAGKHASGPVSAVGRRGQTHEKESRGGVAETRIWFSPVVPRLEPFCLLARDAFTPSDQSWTPAARNNLALN